MMLPSHFLQAISMTVRSCHKPKLCQRSDTTVLWRWNDGQSPSLSPCFHRSVAAMATINAQKKAAECERAIRRARNPDRRIVLENLRSLWVTIGSAKVLMTDADMAKNIRAINRITADLRAFWPLPNGPPSVTPVISQWQRLWLATW